MAPKKRRKFNTCPNCAYQFHGVDNFCPNCGQENHNLNVPFKHLFLELLEGTLHFDTKFWHTIKLLLFKPGRLTEQFVLNKRASYVPPIRLYVFISFIFFLIIATIPYTSPKRPESRIRLRPLLPSKKIPIRILTPIRPAKILRALRPLPIPLNSILFCGPIIYPRIILPAPLCRKSPDLYRILPKNARTGSTKMYR